MDYVAAAAGSIVVRTSTDALAGRQVNPVTLDDGVPFDVGQRPAGLVLVDAAPSGITPWGTREH